MKTFVFFATFVSKLYLASFFAGCDLFDAQEQQFRITRA